MPIFGAAAHNGSVTARARWPEAMAVADCLSFRCWWLRVCLNVTEPGVDELRDRVGVGEVQGALEAGREVCGTVDGDTERRGWVRLYPGADDEDGGPIFDHDADVAPRRVTGALRVTGARRRARVCRLTAGRRTGRSLNARRASRRCASGAIIGAAAASPAGGRGPRGWTTGGCPCRATEYSRAASDLHL